MLTDEPGLLGPKARERNIGGGRCSMIKDSYVGDDLAFMSFCISEFFVLFVYVYADSLESS